MQTKSNKRAHLPGITVDPNMPDFSKCDLVLAKAESGRAHFEKYGLPKAWVAERKAKKTLKG